MGVSGGEPSIIAVSTRHYSTGFYCQKMCLEKRHEVRVLNEKKLLQSRKKAEVVIVHKEKKLSECRMRNHKAESTHTQKLHQQTPSA